MSIPWGTIKSLLIFFAPVLIPRAITTYRSLRAAPKLYNVHPQPLPTPILRSILLLALLTLSYLLLLLPPLTPENIFTLTTSRLQIPTDVLFTRLASLRPRRVLTNRDVALRSRFVSLESRLLYLQYGPATVADCPFCVSDDPRSYLFYALPELVTPHLINLIALAFATSTLLTGRGITGGNVQRFRAPATLASIAVATLDLWSVATYNHGANARALRLQELDMFYWRARATRYLLLATLNIICSAVFYLSGTNRAFVRPPTATARIESVTRALSTVKSRINAAGIIKNTVQRDEGLRGRSMSYWTHEGKLMREVMEEKEVVEGIKDALEKRIDIKSVERDAEAYVREFFGNRELVEDDDD